MTSWSDRFAINTYAYTQSLSAAECVRRLADRGVRWFELMFYPGHLWINDSAGQLRDLRRAIEETGATVVSLNSPNIDLNIAAATEEMRALSIRLIGEYLRLAAELNVGGLILGPGKANPLFSLPRATLETYFFRALDTLLPLAERGNVELLVENMPFAFIPDAEGLLGALGRYGADEIKICYDVANAHFIGEDPVTGLEQIGNRLRLIHFSDTNQSVYRHDPVGEGTVEFARLAPAIKAASLKQSPVLEIISTEPDRDIAHSIEALVAMNY
jgi:sugar phosphate isomerase/epimerase